MDTFEKTLRELQGEFEEALSRYLDEMHLQPAVLDESFRYLLMNGGKRIRPVLMFAAAKMLGGKFSDVAEFALALEMIHTYSLIHDDLPSMDNDDYRRGKPSSHRQFGEGQAVLAGDALLNEAYSVCFEACKRGRTYLDAAAFLCRNAGVYGMVAGQAADLACQGGGTFGKTESDFIILNKTAKMLISAAAVPAYVYGSDENIRSILAEFGTNLGFLFQITDDLLDTEGDLASLGKTPGKDAAENKFSSVALYGADACREQADRFALSCKELLDSLPYESAFLQEFVDRVRARQS